MVRHDCKKVLAAQAQALRVVTVKPRDCFEGGGAQQWPVDSWTLESRDRWGDADVETEYVTCLELARQAPATEARPLKIEGAEGLRGTSSSCSDESHRAGPAKPPG